jgi:2-keto-myo-inositol isomerase
VHDTFHHALAHGGDFFPQHTGIVHISGVADPAPALDQMTDAHRVLVDADDRLANVVQLQTLGDLGWSGPISFECFAPQTHASPDPAGDLRASMALISLGLTA